MRKRIKNLLVALMSLAMLASGITGTDYHVKAAAGDVKITQEGDYIVKPGETSHIKLSVAASSLPVMNPNIEVTAADGAPFTFTTPTISMNGLPVNNIGTGTSTDLEFDVKVKDSAEIGNYPIQIKFTYRSVLDSSVFEDCSITTHLKINEEKIPEQLTVGHVKLGDTNIGSDTDLSFVIQNEGEITAKNVYLLMSYGDIIEEKYTAKNIKVGDIAPGEMKNMKLPVSILSTAATGRKTITAKFTYKTTDGDDRNSEYTMSVNLTAVASEIKTPKLNVEDIRYGGGLKPGDDFTLAVSLKNIGGAEAKNISVAVDDSSVDATSILKKYFTEGISVDNMQKDTKAAVEIPLAVSKYATGGLKGVKVVVTYTDEAGNAYNLAETVYVDVIAATSESGAPNLVVSNVIQSPAQPQAGGKVEISFDLENKSKVDAAELKIALEGLTSATFIPLKSEPYQYVELLKGGDKIRVTIPLTVSENIVEGLNNIAVKFTYNGGGDTVVIPVKDVQNEAVISSKPKLIVSKYSDDVEELRAGSVFNFTFDIYNTNASVTAKNITVTITQADNIFSVTQGSNSFFINKIDPGETVTETVEMKVKSDASTKTYPLEILIEYEYDGAEPNPTTGEVGESRTEKLNLQAVENSRPVLENISVYSWDGYITVGNPATLTFEFYNMGRSPLNNVTVAVEGDFTKADGSMHIIGNVAEGTPTYAEFDVIPNVEGTANGILRVTFEDSNGDPVEFTKEFSQEIMPAGGMMDPGIFDPGTDEVFNPGGIAAKKEIVPIWAFVIIQIAIFILFVPVTRKIIISVYKGKLRKKEMEQY
jgi:hypothetical protein